MICAWMVTSSAVVASVGDQQGRGLARQRDGGSCPLAHAPENWWGKTQARVSALRDADGFEKLDRPFARRGAAELLMGAANSLSAGRP